jgi:hypothetical protein
MAATCVRPVVILEWRSSAMCAMSSPNTSAVAMSISAADKRIIRRSEFVFERSPTGRVPVEKLSIATNQENR